MTEPGTSPHLRATLLRGGPVARAIREEVRREADALAGDGRPPRLRVLLMGEDPASRTYVAAKTLAAEASGIVADTICLPGDAGDETLLGAIADANGDPDVDGVLVQLPLPSRRLAARVFDSLAPEKDVDGLHPENVGRLAQGRPRFVPCTPAGILALLDAHEIPIAGRSAVVIGRSDIVGKPLATLLSARDATVTLCHSRTRAIAEVCREADLLFAATGRAGLVRASWVKRGAVVVDVGVNRFGTLAEMPEHLRASARLRDAIQARGEALAGDVAFDEVAEVADWLTPVPGGVGPLTVAMLLKNTVLAARSARAGAAKLFS